MTPVVRRDPRLLQVALTVGLKCPRLNRHRRQQTVRIPTQSVSTHTAASLSATAQLARAIGSRDRSWFERQSRDGIASSLAIRRFVSRYERLAATLRRLLGQLGQPLVIWFV